MNAGWKKRMACVLGLALLAGGCGLFTERKPPPPCPPIFVLKDAGSVTRYKPGPGSDITDVLFHGKIIDFQGLCEYNSERTRVEISLSIAFEMSRGPANTDRKADFAYFVAIPKFHPAPQGKKIFPLATSFVENTTRVRLTDEITLEIPIDKKVKRQAYATYIGFDLTQDELKENRRRTRF
ncbi:MAG: hypothetical protein HOM58_11785 [Rhodospirillaceae bacterium]|jgi:hypothetical protein|nr:hypothetical protein [Rhodospirillaceae bacterium]MBT5456139.1 hypothetical protein [Rhodospirillaceae bacterium]